ncbi:MAG: hypothetical protein ACKOIA_12175 [Acidimicrobiia bacterium]
MNPDCRLVLVLVDQVPDDDLTLAMLGSFDEVIVARDLFDIGFSQWIFGHDVVEACTAVKGRALQVLLDRGDIVYVDPDMAVFGSLDDSSPNSERLRCCSLLMCWARSRRARRTSAMNSRLFDMVRTTSACSA